MIKVLMSFLIVGLICGIGSLIYNFTKLTPGHITSLFVVSGAILSIFGIYDKLISSFGYGLCLPIVSFGNSLVNSATSGFHTSGFIGLFSQMLYTTSAGIAGTVIFSFIVTLFSKPKE